MNDTGWMTATGRVEAAPPSPIVERALRSLIHRTDPYAGIETAEYVPDIQGWNCHSPVFGELIALHHPDRIAEVGTWKGASAIHMARQSPASEILCIDTWLGSDEFWAETPPDDLALVNGYPSVYQTFIRNVVQSGFADRIAPFPATSAMAARFLAKRGILFDMIYLDASHDVADVYCDVLAYWRLVRPGGVLFGDDYDWSGVRTAVDAATRMFGRAVKVCGEKWIITKDE